MSFWAGRRTLVTGGAGFIGSHVVEMLVAKEAEVTVADNLENGRLENLDSVREDVDFKNLDLGDLDSCVEACHKVEVVVNLAAKVGGIDFNQKHQGIMFRDNILINTNMLEAARQVGVDRFLVVSSACIYPRVCTIPTPEAEGFVGNPEPTNYGYGWAKRMAEVQAEVYAQEFGMHIGVVRPYNTYGPRDHFEPEKSHVIPALIKRVLEGENPVVVWGDGEQSRAFLYVTDLARGLLDAIENYPVPDPINLGTDEEVKIRELVGLIVALSGRAPAIVFDTSKPSGHPRRNCDTRKAKEKIGFQARVRLEEGLRSTVEWYVRERKAPETPSGVEVGVGKG